MKTETELRQNTAAAVLNELVANQGVLYTKLHQYHWHVQGPHFFTLHVKYEELYDETTADFDAFAERLIAQGYRPFSTLSEFLEYSTIEERVYDEHLSADQMVNNTISDYEVLKNIARRGAELAGDEGDVVTEDMLVAYIEKIDLTIWMLDAYLKG
ncbi:MAG TPA: DNA starvation/stationary phase protection protein [Bacillota bacterium]|nr:DNA starvation/stationary phase protection protein [Bacillota bacterium]